MKYEIIRNCTMFYQEKKKTNIPTHFLGKVQKHLKIHSKVKQLIKSRRDLIRRKILRWDSKHIYRDIKKPFVI